MLTIYSVPVATYCAKLRVMMRHKGILWEELPPPGGYGSDEYRAIVPSGNLPAMIDGALQLGDSEAIAEYLNEAYPDIAMLPQDLKLRAKVREKGRFHDTRLEPAVRAFYPQVAFETRDPATVSALGDAMTRHLSALEVLLAHSPLDTETLWLCDCGFAVTFAWIRAFEGACGLKVSWPEAVLDYDARLNRFPAVRAELAHYSPAMDAYLEKARPAH